MDNRIFSVNGEGDDLLLATLRLVFAQDGFGDRPQSCAAWSVSKTHGLILHWHKGDPNTDTGKHKLNAFPCEMSADDCLPFVSKWLKSKEAGETKLSGWDAQTDHDGSDESGWRVYCEDWGHVDDHSSAICGIKPVVLWLGK